MKKLKLLAMLGALGGVLLFSTGCNSKEQPIDKKYTGTYTSASAGSMNVTTTTVSSQRGIYLPVLTVDNVTYNTATSAIKWDPTVFNYFSDQTYNFTTYVTVTGNTTIKGMSSFHGTFAERTQTYDVSIIDDNGKTTLFSKSKF